MPSDTKGLVLLNEKVSSDLGSGLMTTEKEKKIRKNLLKHGEDEAIKTRK